MEQQRLKDYFVDSGFIIFDQLLDEKDVVSIESRHSELTPCRGHGIDNSYWPKDKIKDCPELALWWSQQVTDWPEVRRISKTLLDKLGFLFDDPAIYVTDVISNTPKNKFIKPHIDSPYRFDRWHNEVELLGVQCIIPLCPFTKENGATGLLPGSHKKDWVVLESYRGVYNEEFLANAVQPPMLLGDVLVYNPRMLHSTMPNNTATTRRALLIHITSQSMVEKLRLVDNIWIG
jgi:hypothetical protein